MALLKAIDYIYQALRKCGHMRAGYTPPLEFMVDAMNEWWAMFDGFNSERTMNYSNPDFLYPVTGPGSQSNGNGYQIGPTGADWVGPRPESIIRANLKYTSVGTAPVFIHLVPISQEQWAALSIRQLTPIQVTQSFWYDPQFPNGVFNVFPPLSAGNSIEIFTWGVLAPPGAAAASAAELVVALQEDYSAPPGYADVVIYGLAYRLWPMCSKSMMANKVPHQWLQGQALRAATKVRNVNRPIPTLASDYPTGRGRGGAYYDRNIGLTGEPY